MINDQGGVNGRKINFITLDDGYSPPKTVEQVRRLVEQDEALLLFQSLGTPANSAIHRWRFSRRSSPSAGRQFRERSLPKLCDPTRKAMRPIRPSRSPCIDSANCWAMTRPCCSTRRA